MNKYIQLINNATEKQKMYRYLILVFIVIEPTLWSWKD